MPLLSIVIPCYNETATLRTSVTQVLAIASAETAVQVIIVDDCSTDGSWVIAQELARESNRVIARRFDRNTGKGAALRAGFALATGDFVAVHDADLEYDPRDLLTLMKPLVDGVADAVIGSRFIASGPHRVLYFWHSMGNHLLTFLSNIATDLNLSDMESCYKVVRRDVLQRITLRENRFGFEPEIVAKLARLRPAIRIYEMGVSYHGRTYSEGKKIRMKDGFRALYCIVKYGVFRGK